MERLIVVIVVGVVALAVAALLQRRRPAAPAPTGYHVPTQLHRGDFVRPDAPWLVTVFSSSTCDACAGMVDKARALESDAVAVQEVESVADAALHDRYLIDGVPTTVVADAAGEVVAHFLGPATATDLWAAVAEARQPGTVPDGCHGHGDPVDEGASTGSLDLERP